MTSVDLFHGEKDDNIPVTIEIRNVINGNPGAKIIPFSRVTKNPADISLSTNASVATTYTFESPVFLKNNTEYGIAVISSVPTHKVWISRMGETETGGTRTISRQTYSKTTFRRSRAPACA